MQNSSFIKAPTIDGSVWLNGRPELGGKVVLIDFWTYSCVNCLRTLPYLKSWWQKFKDSNFVIVGVHSPEFVFEKSIKNVEDAVESLGITWPVVLDNDHEIWNGFANRYWPAHYLLDASGRIVYEHFGEGAYAETERAISDQLGGKPTADRLAEHRHGSVCVPPTPETYCGYLRGLFSNAEIKPEEVYSYNAPMQIGEGKPALSGKFNLKPEYIESAELGSSIRLKFKGSEVNLVMEPVGHEAVVNVLFNGQKIRENFKGSDLDVSGNLNISKPRMYSLLRADAILEGELEIVAVMNNFRAYAFTFSGCV